ncbi:MAG: ERF family protein [Clostridia bacterium]|nr:ERF family protein [Clostridia bacterium]
MNIFEKMAAITAELQTVAKNLTVQQTKTTSYKAVSERDILDAVKPLETEHGVYSYPVSRKVLESNMLESESTYNGQTTKKTIFMTRIETIYRFVNVEKPEEYIETTTFAEGIDSQDKGSGKAMTYADKYALMKAYKISTGDDPDQSASEENNYKCKNTAEAETQVPKVEAPPVKNTLTVAQQKQIMDAWEAKNGQVAGDNIAKYGDFLKMFGVNKTAEIKCTDFDKVLKAI